MSYATPNRQFEIQEKVSETEPLLGNVVEHDVCRVPSQDYPRNVRRRRFWHFSACALLLISATYVFAFKGREVHFLRSEQGKHSSQEHCWDGITWTPHTSPVPDRYPLHARASVELPLTTAGLSFVSEGWNQAGEFEVVQDLDAGLGATTLDIQVSYISEDIMDRTVVCRTHPSDGEGPWGLGIFGEYVRYPRRHLPELFFHMTLHLPRAPSDDAPLRIEHLSSRLPAFSQHLADFARSVYFEDIDLKSSNKHITVDSAAGKHILFHTSNAKIGGTFNTSSSLVLETSNALIDVDTTLLSEDSLTSLTLKTSNGKITGDIHLISTQSDGTRGLYSVDAHSSNAALALTVHEAPVDSELAFNARSSNAPIGVRLPTTYEGTFDLATSSSNHADVVWRPDVEDPAGKGRTHRVSVNKIKKGHAAGYAVWSEERSTAGKVVIKSSNAPVRLDL